MTPNSNNPTDSQSESAQEERLGELINEFFDRRESGEGLSKEAFLAEHGDVANELRQHLASLDLLEGIGSSSKLSTLPGDQVGRSPPDLKEKRSPEKIPPPEIPGYEILKMIGRGGMGLVYKATQQSTQRDVALKLLLEGPLASEQARRRFEREIALAAQLHHPSIIPIYDSGTCDGRMYYAMEYIRGLALCDYLENHPLPLQAKLRLFIKICHAVQHAHQQGVVHRDLKPTNIMIDTEGNPHILDFGLAKAGSLIDHKTSITAQLAGTPAYMSPEQAAGDPSGIDIRTDIYSLGVVLYQMLTGYLPYETDVPMGKLLENISHAEPESPAQYDPKIDGDLSAILFKALSKKRNERYQSLDTFSNDITQYLAGEPISIQPASVLYLLKKMIGKHRAMLIIVVTMIVIALSVGIMVQHFTAKLGREVARNREKEEKLVAQLAESDKLRRDSETLARQRDDAERARAAYQAILRTIDPELAKGLDALTQGLADPYTAIPKLLAEGVSGLNTSDSTDATTQKTHPGSGDPLSGRPPSRANPKRNNPNLEISPELLRLLRALVPPTTSPSKVLPTTQPASTQATASSADTPPKNPSAGSGGL